MQTDSINQSLLVATWVMAFGTVLLAVLAIFGETIQGWVFRPNLSIKINNPLGELVRWSDIGKTRGIYYHLKIENHGWAMAKNVRVLCSEIRKQRPGAALVAEPLAAPEQLMWRFSNFYGMVRDIPKGYGGKIGMLCDLGFVNEGGTPFQITPYATTESFPGFINPNESLELTLVVAADNFSPKKPYKIIITWDGKWFDNLHEMRKHLVIDETK